MIRAAFLDRDGVINSRAPEGDYITCWHDMHFLPGVARAISLLNKNGYLVIVVTNQRCVAKGLISAEQLKMIHRRMCMELEFVGARIDEIYSCIHGLEPACSCRKPAPGMLLEAARVHGIDLTESWMIGDSEIDMRAGRSAGCKTALIASDERVVAARDDLTARSLLEVVQQLLKETGMTTVLRGSIYGNN